jgi:hypothetical protein
MLAGLLAALAFVFLALVGPGIAIQRLFRLPVDPALVLPLGAAFTSGMYWASLTLGWPLFFPLAVAAACLIALAGWGRWELAPGPGLSGTLAPFAALVLFFSVTAYPWNVYGPQGEFILDPLVPYDTAFHVGLARELTIGYPPQVPGISGFPLGYHLGADLVRAAALRWLALDPYDAITRMDTTLGALALVLLLRTVTQRLGAPPWAVAIAPWTLLATDFSFALAWSPQAHWWTDLLRGNLLLSLDLANPIVPALALGLGALVALDRHCAAEGRGWLVLAMLQALAIPFFKVFLGAHLLLGLGVAALLGPASSRRATLLAAAPALVATAALALGQGGRTVEAVLAPLDLVRTTRETLGLAPATGMSLLLWSLAWIMLSLGLRIFGLPSAIAALRAKTTPLAPALAAMALSGWPLGLLFRVSAPAVLAGQKVINDAAFLVEQSGPLLWVFTTIALARFARRSGVAALAAALAGLLALPSTAHFVYEKNHWPNDAIPASRVRAMRALEKASRPGDVVLQRPGARFPPAPVVLIGRRVPYERFTPWLTQFADPRDLATRHEVVYRFFRTGDAEEAKGIARGLGARFVCLYDGERVRFSTAEVMETIYDEPEARVFRLRER